MPESTFYQYLSLISGISSLLLGLFVFGKNRKLRLNQVFFFFTLSCAIWLLGSFMMLKSKTDQEAIFWDRVVYFGVVFIPILAYHVSLLFSKIKNQKNLLSVGYFLSVFFLILSRTDYFVADLYKYSWGVHTQARFFHHIFLIFFAFYFILFFLNIYQFHRKTTGAEHSQAAYFLLASFIMVISSLAFLPAYGINFPPFSYFAVVAFVLILTLAITRYHLFEIRVILTEILVGAMGIILVILPFVMPTGSLKILTLAIFFLFLIFAYYLVKATHEESKRREEAERLAIQERALRMKIEKLASETEKLARAKDQFLLSIQHHLRTPLTPIRGYSEMILEGSYGQEENPKIKEKLLSIKKSADTLHELMESLLDIQAMRMGKEILNLEKCQLGDLVGEVVEELKPQAEEKGLLLQFEKDSLPETKLDRKRIKEVIWNLIDNAIKYTTKGGITIKVKNANSKIQIMVSDTGVGMTKEEIQDFLSGKLFERGEEAKKLFGPGRGIGLAIATEFVKAHGGKIWAESEGRSKGTTFLVELPIK